MLGKIELYALIGCCFMSRHRRYLIKGGDFSQEKSGKPIKNIISDKLKGDIFGKISPFVYVNLSYQKTFKTSSSVLRFTFVGSVAG